jgi:hypothetical protein
MARRALPSSRHAGVAVDVFAVRSGLQAGRGMMGTQKRVHARLRRAKSAFTRVFDVLFPVVTTVKARATPRDIRAL